MPQVRPLQSMNETQLTEELDERGLLDDARGPGVYALEVATPPTLDAVRRQWDSAHDARPPEGTLDRLASAADVAYVGAATHVYQRLSDHVTRERRKSAFLTAFPPERVVTVWSYENPFDAEYNAAQRLARRGWKVWTDGELYG